jgi:acetamidase/formamidase
MLDELYKPFVRNRIEEAAYVQIEHPVHFLRQKSRIKRIQRIMLASLGTEPGTSSCVPSIYSWRYRRGLLPPARNRSN